MPPHSQTGMRGEFLAHLLERAPVRKNTYTYIFFGRVGASMVIAGETLLIHKTYINSLKRQESIVCVLFFFPPNRQTKQRLTQP